MVWPRRFVAEVCSGPRTTTDVKAFSVVFSGCGHIPTISTHPCTKGTPHCNRSIPWKHTVLLMSYRGPSYIQYVRQKGPDTLFHGQSGIMWNRIREWLCGRRDTADSQGEDVGVLDPFLVSRGQTPTSLQRRLLIHSLYPHSYPKDDTTVFLPEHL